MLVFILLLHLLLLKSALHRACEPNQKKPICGRKNYVILHLFALFSAPPPTLFTAFIVPSSNAKRVEGSVVHLCA